MHHTKSYSRFLLTSVPKTMFNPNSQSDQIDRFGVLSHAHPAQFIKSFKLLEVYGLQGESVQLGKSLEPNQLYIK